MTGLNPEPTTDNVARMVMLLFRAAIVLVFVLLVGRLYQLQIVRGDSYRLSADNNRFRLQEVAAPRGVMYDRTGQILVRNRPSFEASLVPDDLPFDDPETEGRQRNHGGDRPRSICWRRTRTRRSPSASAN
ncbi:MAG: hypothetical protein R2854_01920 [Caldilineaceae bacterium]